MNEERKMILQMVQDGSISVEEAEKLLEAIPAGEPDRALVAAPAGGPMPKRLLVTVMENGKTKVNVKIPFSLVRTGLKLGKTFGALGVKYSKDGSEDVAVMELLQNLDIDELLSSITEGDISLPYKLVDVEDEEKGEKVEVILE